MEVIKDSAYSSPSHSYLNVQNRAVKLQSTKAFPNYKTALREILNGSLVILMLLGKRLIVLYGVIEEKVFFINAHHEELVTILKRIKNESIEAYTSTKVK